MTVDQLEIPYQFDVTAITSVVNQVVNKIIEVANEGMVPTEAKPFAEIDLVEIADVMRLVASWQTSLVNEIGLPSSLIPKTYENVDYNSIGSKAMYYSSTINNIIDALNDNVQNEPEDYLGEDDEQTRKN